MKDHPSQSAVRPVMEKYMRERLAKKPELAERLIPKWVSSHIVDIVDDDC